MPTNKEVPPIHCGTSETVKVIVKNQYGKLVGHYAYFNSVEDCWFDASSGDRYEHEKVESWKPIKNHQS